MLGSPAIRLWHRAPVGAGASAAAGGASAGVAGASAPVGGASAAIAGASAPPSTGPAPPEGPKDPVHAMAKPTKPTMVNRALFISREATPLRVHESVSCLTFP